MSGIGDDPILKELSKVKIDLIFEYPFFGTLLLNLPMVDGTKWCNTAATDGRYIYYNREFIKDVLAKHGRPGLAFLLMHELLHCVYDHMGRTGHRNRKLLNMAQDYIINYTLVKQKIGKMITGGLYDEKYTDDMTSEEVYNLLEQNCVTIQMTIDEHLELTPGGGNSDGDGSGEGKSVSVTVMGEDGPPTITEEDLAEIRNNMKNALRSAKIHATKDAGYIPAGIRRMLEEMDEPILDWRALLDAHIRSSQKDDFTFQRISRREWSLGGIRLPAQDYMNTIDIAVAIDTSGSMTEEMLTDFLAEVKGIMETFRDFKLKLWTFDTKVYNCVEFTGRNIDDILDYEVKGGGGTDFECNWEYMKDNGITPERFVMLTDGYPCSGWGDEHYCDTLFVVHSNNDHSITAPFGITTYYDSDKKKN